MQPPQAREAHAHQQHPILEGHNGSLDAGPCKQGDSGGVTNVGADLWVRDSGVLEKTLEDAVPDVT